MELHPLTKFHYNMILENNRQGNLVQIQYFFEIKHYQFCREGWKRRDFKSITRAFVVHLSWFTFRNIMQFIKNHTER